MSDADLVRDGSKNLRDEMMDRAADIAKLEEKLKNGTISQQDFDSQKRSQVNKISQNGRMYSQNEKVIEKIEKGIELDSNEQTIVDTYKEARSKGYL
ncbi:MAG: hypothetical protein HRU19_01950 [Pseudobacteriovorax sp.]|nr:hypothetical protein [Pseudobacteriovorax sp.]